MKCFSHNKFFEVMGGKTRLRILEILKTKPKCVSDICHDVKEEQSKVSHNLRVLRECNFVEQKIVGKKRVYSLNKKTIVPLMKIVDKHVSSFCTGCDKR